MLLTPAQIEPKSFESRRTLFFLPGGGCVSCLRACLGAMLLPQSYQYPNLSEGADRVGGQLRGDKECPFSGVTKSGRVWRKVPESDAWSVGWPVNPAAWNVKVVWILSLCEMGWPSGWSELVAWAHIKSSSGFLVLFFFFFFCCRTVTGTAHLKICFVRDG